MTAPPAVPRPAGANVPVPRSPDRAREVAVLAMTLRAQAGERPVRALEALAALVMNRVAAGAPRWAGGLEAVCRDPFGFPCWNPRHPRHVRLRAPDAGEGAASCRRIALRAMVGALPDPTGGATHWHADDEQPGWSLGLVPLAELGGLLFYHPEPVAAPSASDRSNGAAASGSGNA